MFSVLSSLYLNLRSLYSLVPYFVLRAPFYVPQCPYSVLCAMLYVRHSLHFLLLLRTLFSGLPPPYKSLFSELCSLTSFCILSSLNFALRPSRFSVRCSHVLYFPYSVPMHYIFRTLFPYTIFSVLIVLSTQTPFSILSSLYTGSCSLYFSL